LPLRIRGMILIYKNQKNNFLQNSGQVLNFYLSVSRYSPHLNLESLNYYNSGLIGDKNLIFMSLDRGGS